MSLLLRFDSGELSSLEEVREIARRSFAPKVYEPHETAVTA